MAEVYFIKYTVLYDVIRAHHMQSTRVFDRLGRRGAKNVRVLHVHANRVGIQKHVVFTFVQTLYEAVGLVTHHPCASPLFAVKYSTGSSPYSVNAHRVTLRGSLIRQR